MMVYPIAPWWLILGIGLLLCGLVGWQLWTYRRKPLRFRSWLRRLGLVLLLVALLLRPTLPGGSGVAGVANADVFFVIDTTVSMSAEDYDGGQQRIAGVGADIKALASKLAGARFTVITFDNESNLELPLTSDVSAVTSLAGALQTQIALYGNGSTISRPIDLLKSELQRVRQQSPDRKQLVYYFGDGEQTADEKPSSFASLKPFVDGGGVLGYGTSEGGKMKDLTGYTSIPGITPSYLRDYSNPSSFGSNDALSKIDEANLQAVADQLGVSYQHQTKPGKTAAIYSHIDVDNLSGPSSDISLREDTYWLIACGIVGLLAWEVYALLPTLREIRRPRRSL